MVALLAGLAGIVLGWALKSASDLLAEQRANRRADLVWRRQQYVDAVARLAHAGRELMSADSAVSRATHSLTNARQGGDPDIIAECQARSQAADERQDLWITPTLQALEAVRLYAPPTVVNAANTVWDAIHHDGRFPAVSDISAFERKVIDALSSLRAEAREAADLR